MRALQRLVPIVCLTLFAVVPPVRAEEENRQLESWVEQLVLGAELGDKKSFCKRWTHTPTLSVNGGSAGQHKIVAGVVKQLNDVLAKTPIKKIDQLKPNDYDADICVHLVPMTQMEYKATEFDAPEYKFGWRSPFWVVWNDKHELLKAHVLIAVDQFDSTAFQCIVLTDIAAALGICHFAPTYPDSIFFKKGGRFGKAKKLTDIDAKLLVFLYTRMKPGDSRDEVRNEFKETWKDLK